MKKLIITIALLCSVVTLGYSQEFKKEGNTYVKETTVKQSTETKTEFLYDDGKATYPIYIGKTGSCYIKKISKKTGKEYRQYLGEEISKDICAQLKVEYKGKTSNQQ